MKPSLVENQWIKTTSENPKQLRAEGNGLQSQISRASVISKNLGRETSLCDSTKPNK